eukprot:2117901-Pyramimonas_sp.AAC.1
MESIRVSSSARSGLRSVQYRYSTGTVQAQYLALQEEELPWKGSIGWGRPVGRARARRSSRASAQYRYSTGTVQAQYRHSGLTLFEDGVVLLGVHEREEAREHLQVAVGEARPEPEADQMRFLEMRQQRPRLVLHSLRRDHLRDTSVPHA